MRGPWPSPFWPNMFASCKKQLSWHKCASLVPLGMKWACICAGIECCVWLCVGGVSMCQCVSACDSVCCLRCVVGCVNVGVDALAVVGLKERRNL